MEVAAPGTKDENLIPVLHRLPQPTFLSLDRDFYRPALAHSGYCLVWLDVRGRLAAEFIRRFLKHPQFDTQAKRMGLIVRAHALGVHFWRVGDRREHTTLWPDE